VQGFGADPASIGSEFVDTVHEALDALADGVVNVESDEEAHELRVSPLKGAVHV
jgi:hypothetical protein